MERFKFKGITIDVYRDPMEFAKMEEKPFGDIPEEYQFAGIVDIETGDIGVSKSTGFTILDDRTIHFYIDPECTFEDLLETVAHELGHLVEGGFKKNPPQKRRYHRRHEEKAEHYECFVMDSFNLTKLILKQ